MASVDATTFVINEQTLDMRINQTEFYLKEFEKEVEKAQGASGRRFYMEDALSRIKLLMEYNPNHPKIKEFFKRAQACLIQSEGGSTKIDSKYTQYLVNEENMRNHYAKISLAKWESLLAEYKDLLLEKTFPTPDCMEVPLEEVEGKYVVLDAVRYPRNQFCGVTGEYIWTGKRSTGMYFVRIDSRKWLGPYEAIKRYRREVDTTLEDVQTWTVLGKISGITMEIPEAGEKKVGPAIMSWVVDPVALYVPEHCIGIYDENNDASGYFEGEEEVEGIKQSWYTVTEIPNDVTPERLCEIFLTALKEKNYPLFLDCIAPEMRNEVSEDTARMVEQEMTVQTSNISYHWDLHQQRLHGQYVHATFDPEKTEITVVHGFDDRNDLKAFFLTDEQKAEMKRIHGEKLEYAVVQSKVFDANGKQAGSPNTRTLQRRGEGRWYIREYDNPF